MPSTVSVGLRMFVISWVAYVGFYLCRSNLSIILPLFVSQKTLTGSQLTALIFSFSVAYCVGQFLMGRLSDEVGARRVVAGGMVGSAVFTVAMGFSSSFGPILALQILNGLAQSAGWSGVMRLMKESQRQTTGVMMGWWSTNYVMGSLLGKLFATFSLGAPWLPVSGWLGAGTWQRAAVLPAVLLFGLGVAFYWLTHGHVEHPGMETRTKAGVATSNRDSVSGRVALLAGAYLFVKTIRYALLFWLPLYLTSFLHLPPTRAGYLSSRFELFGIAGVVGAAYLSDRLLKSRRFPVALGAMVLLALGCGAYACVQSGEKESWLALLTGFLGFAMFAADSILVGAATQDAAGEGEISTVAGIVDGAGSCGQVLSPVLVGVVSNEFGWPMVFKVLAILAVASTAILYWGARMERRPQLPI